MISDYDPSSGEYGSPRPIGMRPNAPTPQATKTSVTPPPTDDNHWNDYLMGMLADAQNNQYRGGGYKPAFSQQYQDYTNNMYGRVGEYMDDPRGYSDEELGMMRGQGIDAITAQGGGYRQMMEDAQKNKGFYGGW